jgi:AcrR family transcriptional regulator
MPKGRPRNFDIDAALDKAMMVFWRKGYEGTSLPDLTGAIGITRPSLYAAFGSKEELFTKALDRYQAVPGSYVDRALEKSTAREVFESLLYGEIDLLTNEDHPGGCLLVQAALACSGTAESVRNELKLRRQTSEQGFRKRFELAAKEGDLPTNCTAEVLARYTSTVMWGLAVQSANGSNREELLAVAELAIDNWPG